ncbi:MAG: hypothetical protein LBC64_09140 [Fibromonadaceae bacterium]|jgi:hypothetical protein|nr:hypothetical protein [Fibromonadaceae bacterium]
MLIIDYHRHDLIHPIHGKHFYSQWKGKKGGNGNIGNGGNSNDSNLYKMINGNSGEIYINSFNNITEIWQQ